jgi:endonuclease V-like protein UPF0215 family
MALATVTIEGDDATERILKMFTSLDRDDIVCIMLAGLVISKYNVIDGERLYNETRIPIVAVTHEESQGLEQSIKGRFPNWEAKLAQYSKLVPREKITLRTGKGLFIQRWGISQMEAISLLNSFTLQGSFPEPVRLAKLAARAFSSTML